jgi:hypothetical protein
MGMPHLCALIAFGENAAAEVYTANQTSPLADRGGRDKAAPRQDRVNVISGAF